jgi:hypothetical protein
LGSRLGASWKIIRLYSNEKQEEWAYFGEPLRIVNDGTDNFGTFEIVLLVCADLHLEVVETLRDGFFCEAGYLLVCVACSPTHSGLAKEDLLSKKAKILA